VIRVTPLEAEPSLTGLGDPVAENNANKSSSEKKDKTSNKIDWSPNQRIGDRNPMRTKRVTFTFDPIRNAEIPSHSFTTTQFSLNNKTLAN